MSSSTRVSTTTDPCPTAAKVARWQQGRDAWRRFQRHRVAMAGLLILGGMGLLVLTARFWTTQDPTRQQLSQVLRPLSLQHPCGTDHLGRDMLARLLYGGRLSLLIGGIAVIIGLVFGVPLGALSGFRGGLTDILLQRLADVLLSFPGFLLALALASMLGVGLRNVVIAVGISAIPSFMRLVRGSVLTVREYLFVEAARALGQHPLLIVLRHILPHTLAPIIVQATLNLGSSILLAAGLGFLGLGVQPPTAEWGTMLGEGRQYIFRAPLLTVFPGVAIFLAVLGFNLLGDGLRDALDPRMSQL